MCGGFRKRIKGLGVFVTSPSDANRYFSSLEIRSVQQSIIPADMKSFIDSVITLGNGCQVIIAITLNSKEFVNI